MNTEPGRPIYRQCTSCGWLGAPSFFSGDKCNCCCGIKGPTAESKEKYDSLTRFVQTKQE